jgi:hypothetical protein
MLNSGLDKRDDFPRLGKAPGLCLGKNYVAVNPDIIYSIGTRHQLNVGIKPFFQFVSQPGSSWQIISLCTIFDTDFH